MPATQRPESLSSSPDASSSNSSNCFSPPKRRKAGAKDAEWSNVTDPEVRRRIQNRVAQRKFRIKAKEQRERTDRETKDKEHAGNSYRIPEPDEIDAEPELSGLPWGSVSLSHIMARGYEAESRKSSGRDTHLYDSFVSRYYSPSCSSDMRQTASYGSSGANDTYLDDNPYTYDASIIGQAYPTL